MAAQRAKIRRAAFCLQLERSAEQCSAFPSMSLCAGKNQISIRQKSAGRRRAILYRIASLNYGTSS
jgi:hypothetical protein